MSIPIYAPFSDETPAERLEGVSLDDGWKVLRRIVKTPGSTGGHFSTGYIVADAKGREHFLKAIDFVAATQALDPARQMSNMLAAFNFERDLLQYCKDCKLDRVVTAVHEGRVFVGNDVVQYLVFELADGDVRSQAITKGGFTSSFAFRTLHQVATGLAQLHSNGVAHQDLKPSNVLLFENVGSKLADLGRAVSRAHNGPHESLAVAGDLTYAPPELLYKQIDPDWTRRRCGCDAYLLGSMTAYMFASTPITAEIMSRLQPEFHWRNWHGTFEHVLPHLQGSFADIIASLRNNLPELVRDDVIRIVTELCNPDPALRGHPKTRRQAHGNPLSLERYISEFNLLALRASIKERATAK